MIGWLIVASEIAFWIFVAIGLICRYILKREKLGAFLLFCTPIADLILITVTIFDLRHGAVANFFHGLSAVYVGITVVYGPGMIRWADQYFAFHFADGPSPTKPPKYGMKHAQSARKGWLKHFFTWLVGCLLLSLMILIVGDTSRTESLMRIILLWTGILIIDFLWSFSYSIWPRKERKK